MADKIKTLAEIGFNPKSDADPAEAAKAGAEQKLRAPVPTAEDIQRRANKANHSERAVPMGRKVRW